MKERYKKRAIERRNLVKRHRRNCYVIPEVDQEKVREQDYPESRA